MANSFKRTLFLTRYLLYPPTGGSPLRNWQTVNIMSKYSSVGVFSACPDKPENTNIEAVEFWEHCNTRRKLSRWEKLEHKLWPLRPLAYPMLDDFYSREAAQKLVKILTEFKPDLIICAELWVHQYLKIVKRYSCPIIFDNHNVEADLFLQNYGNRKLQLPRLKAIEKNFIKQADQVWVCSEPDVELSQKLYGNHSHIYAVPNSINVAEYDDVRLNKFPLPKDFEPRPHDILFLGSYNYPPNAIAAKLLVQEIYPEIKKIYPDCRLLLVGRSPNSSLKSASQDDSDIIVTGGVPDVKPYLCAASVVVVPLQKGGGTRLKILEALAAGRPVVSTTKGAEGIQAQDNKHLLIRDNVQDIVQGVCQIWSDSSFAKSLMENGYELVKANYSWESTAHKIDNLIQTL